MTFAALIAVAHAMMLLMAVCKTEGITGTSIFTFAGLKPERSETGLKEGYSSYDATLDAKRT